MYFYITKNEYIYIILFIIIINNNLPPQPQNKKIVMDPTQDQTQDPLQDPLQDPMQDPTQGDAKCPDVRTLFRSFRASKTNINYERGRQEMITKVKDAAKHFLAQTRQDRQKCFDNNIYSNGNTIEYDYIKFLDYARWIVNDRKMNF